MDSAHCLVLDVGHARAFLNLKFFNWKSASNCSEDKRQENEEETPALPVSCMIAPELSHEKRKKVAFDTGTSTSLHRSGTCEDQSK